jgi:hypothetical protein
LIEPIFTVEHVRWVRMQLFPPQVLSSTHCTQPPPPGSHAESPGKWLHCSPLVHVSQA